MTREHLVRGPSRIDAWVTEAAHRLASFAADPVKVPPGPFHLSMGDCDLLVSALPDRSAWTAAAALPAPTAIADALWNHVLLAANIELMHAACLAFGMDGSGQVLLIAQVYGPGAHVQVLAQQLQRFHHVWRSACMAARTPFTSPVAGLDRFLTSGEVQLTVEEMLQRKAVATHCIGDLLIGLGVPEHVACQAAACARGRFGESEIHFSSTVSGHSLLMHVELRRALLDGSCRSALQLTADLMGELGMAAGRSQAGFQLLAHWPYEGREAREFSACLRALAELPAALSDETTVRDAGDSDLDALMPHV
jgi:hypothetical protein